MNRLRRALADTRASSLAVAAVSIVVFAGALGNGFAYDDVTVVAGDPRVTGAASWTSILSGPYVVGTGGEFALYRPLPTLSFAADWALSSGSAGWFHAVNLLWHAGASVLVLLLLRGLFPAAAALAGALVFAVHPVHAEAVANVVGRAELMAAAFALAAAVVWLGAWRWRVAAAGALFAAALLSKESAVMLPPLLLVLDFAKGRWSLQRSELRTYVARSWRGYAALAAVTIAWLVLRAALLGALTPGVVHPAADVAAGRLDLIRTALLAWPEYVRLLFFPVTLLADYGPRVLMPATGWTPGALLGLVVVAAVVVGAVLAVTRRRRTTALALLWFAIAILPVSNLLVTIGTLVAERTLYLPSFSVAVVAAALWNADRSRFPRAAVLRAAVVVAGLLLVTRTMLRVPDWKSTDSIFAALERDRPDSYRAVWYRARALQARRGPAVAHADYLRAVELWPYRRGLVLEAMTNAMNAGEVADARVLVRHAAREWPEDVAMHRLQAALALDVGDTATARQAVAAGLRVDPSDDLLRRMQSAIAQGAAPPPIRESPAAHDVMGSE
ncbi:MAG TPA: hypothetical protein VF039_10095 [Longimicrobiales bacterium]